MQEEEEEAGGGDAPIPLSSANLRNALSRMEEESTVLKSWLTQEKQKGASTQAEVIEELELGCQQSDALMRELGAILGQFESIEFNKDPLPQDMKLMLEEFGFDCSAYENEVAAAESVVRTLEFGSPSAASTTSKAPATESSVESQTQLHSQTQISARESESEEPHSISKEKEKEKEKETDASMSVKNETGIQRTEGSTSLSASAERKSSVSSTSAEATKTRKTTSTTTTSTRVLTQKASKEVEVDGIETKEQSYDLQKESKKTTSDDDDMMRKEIGEQDIGHDGDDARVESEHLENEEYQPSPLSSEKKHVSVVSKTSEDEEWKQKSDDGPDAGKRKDEHPMQSDSTSSSTLAEETSKDEPKKEKPHKSEGKDVLPPVNEADTHETSDARRETRKEKRRHQERDEMERAEEKGKEEEEITAAMHSETIKELETRVAELESVLLEKDAKFVSMSETEEKQVSSLMNMEQILSERDETVKKLSSEIETRDVAIQSITAEKHELVEKNRVETVKLQEKINRLEKLLKERQEKIILLETSIHSLQEEVSSEKATKDDIQTRFDDCSQERDKLASQMEEMKQTLKQCSQEKDAEKRRADDLEKKNKEYQMQVQEIPGLKEDAAHREQVVNLVRVLQSELESAHYRMDELEHERAEVLRLRKLEEEEEEEEEDDDEDDDEEGDDDGQESGTSEGKKSKKKLRKSGRKKVKTEEHSFKVAEFCGVIDHIVGNENVLLWKIVTQLKDENEERKRLYEEESRYLRSRVRELRNRLKMSREFEQETMARAEHDFLETAGIESGQERERDGDVVGDGDGDGDVDGSGDDYDENSDDNDEHVGEKPKESIVVEEDRPPQQPVALSPMRLSPKKTLQSSGVLSPSIYPIQDPRDSIDVSVAKVVQSLHWPFPIAIKRIRPGEYFIDQRRKVRLFRGSPYVIMGREKMFLVDYLKGLYEPLLEVEADISSEQQYSPTPMKSSERGRSPRRLDPLSHSSVSKTPSRSVSVEPRSTMSSSSGRRFVSRSPRQSQTPSPRRSPYYRPTQSSTRRSVTPPKQVEEERTRQESKEEKRIRLLKRRALLEQIRVMKEKEARKR